MLRARSDDTDADAERVQIELLRRAGPERRCRLAFSLSATTIGLARRAILRAIGPDATDTDAALRFVEIHYGRDLADAVRLRLTADGR